MAGNTAGRGTWIWLGAAVLALAVLGLVIGSGSDETLTSPGAPTGDAPAPEPEAPIVLQPATDRQAVLPAPSAVEAPTDRQPPTLEVPSPSSPLGGVVSGTCSEYEAVACGCEHAELCAAARARIRAWMGGGDYRHALERCEQNVELARIACGS